MLNIRFSTPPPPFWVYLLFSLLLLFCLSLYFGYFMGFFFFNRKISYDVVFGFFPSSFSFPVFLALSARSWLIRQTNGQKKANEKDGWTKDNRKGFSNWTILSFLVFFFFFRSFLSPLISLPLASLRYFPFVISFLFFLLKYLVPDVVHMWWNLFNEILNDPNAQTFSFYFFFTSFNLKIARCQNPPPPPVFPSFWF